MAIVETHPAERDSAPEAGWNWPLQSLRQLRIFVWSAAVVLLLAVAVAMYWGGNGAQPVTAAAIGGPFTLVDQHGATVTEAALKGHPSALFFGYTNCPDVCPTTLADMTDWLAKLGPAADRLKVYFVTVDPERDTRDQLAAYLTAFDARIVGLTGSRPAVDQMLKAYRVYWRKVPLEGGAYSMDHTAAVYLLDRNAAFAGTVDYKDDPDKAVAKLKRLIDGA
jgi:protein SCO1/2